MNNIRRNLSGAARSYCSTTKPEVPDVQPPITRFKPIFTGKQVLAWTCLSTSFLYWIDYKGMRTAYNKNLALDKELDEARAHRSGIKARDVQGSTS